PALRIALWPGLSFAGTSQCRRPDLPPAPGHTRSASHIRTPDPVRFCVVDRVACFLIRTILALHSTLPQNEAAGHRFRKNRLHRICFPSSSSVLGFLCSILVIDLIHSYAVSLHGTLSSLGRLRFIVFR